MFSVEWNIQFLKLDGLSFHNRLCSFADHSNYLKTTYSKALGLTCPSKRHQTLEKCKANSFYPSGPSTFKELHKIQELVPTSTNNFGMEN